MNKKCKTLITILSLGLLFSCGKNSITSIKTDDLVKNLDNKDYVIVDARDDSFYNGFKDKDAKRGGHIKGAKQFSCNWFNHIEESKFENFAAGKGITKNKTIIVYDTNKDNLNCVSAEFATRGYKVKIYSDFITYANDEKNPMENFKHFEYSVSPQWINDVISGRKPETYNNDKFEIFEVSWGPLESAKNYQNHIPGAYHFNTDWIENEPVWNLSDPKIIEKNLLENGITKDKTVILYSDNQLAAYRVFFALKWAGVNDVRVMNGNLSTWTNAGFKTESTVNKPTPETTFGTAIPTNPQINISMPADARARQKEGLKLVSNRAWDEYQGKISGYDYIPGKGEPEGAIWGLAGTDSSNVADFYDPDGTLRNINEIIELWKTLGINKGDKLAFYCGTGWRAGVPWFMTQMAAWDNTYIYDGGWNAWQMDKNNPVRKIDNPDASRPDAKNDYGAPIAGVKKKASCKG